MTMTEATATHNSVPEVTHDMSYRVVIGGEPRRVIVHKRTDESVVYQFATADGKHVDILDRTVRLSYRWHRVGADGVIIESSKHRYTPFPGTKDVEYGNEEREH